MKHYVMIFRPARTLSDEEQSQRLKDIGAWVQQMTAMAVSLDPRNLTDTVLNLSVLEQDLMSPGSFAGPSLATIVFFDAENDDMAATIARLHPGPRYGVGLELRAWIAPGQIGVAQ